MTCATVPPIEAGPCSYPSRGCSDKGSWHICTHRGLYLICSGVWHCSLGNSVAADTPPKGTISSIDAHVAWHVMKGCSPFSSENEMLYAVPFAQYPRSTPSGIWSNRKLTSPRRSFAQKTKDRCTTKGTTDGRHWFLAIYCAMGNAMHAIKLPGTDNIDPTYLQR